MREASMQSGGNRFYFQHDRWSLRRRQLWMALLTWPMIPLLGATVAAATCLFSECPMCGGWLADLTFVGNVGTVRSIAFRPDGTMLSSVGLDGSVLIWDMTTRPASAFVPQGIASVRCAQFSPVTGLLAAANVKSPVSIYKLDDCESRALCDDSGETANANCLAFSGMGETLAVGQENGLITLWSAATGRKCATLAGHEDFVVALAFASDGLTLVSSGGNHLTRIWDVPSGKERFRITSPINTYAALALSPDGRLLLLGDQVSSAVRVWDMASGTERAALRGPKGAVVGVAISPDGSTLAAADYQGSVTFWDLASLTLRPGRLKHAGVRTLAFAPGGRSLATGGFDGTVNLWTVPGSTGG